LLIGDASDMSSTTNISNYADYDSGTLSHPGFRGGLDWPG
jgi:hypothetical protein